MFIYKDILQMGYNEAGKEAFWLDNILLWIT